MTLKFPVGSIWLLCDTVIVVIGNEKGAFGDLVHYVADDGRVLWI